MGIKTRLFSPRVRSTIHLPRILPSSQPVPSRRLADCHPSLSVFPPLGIHYHIHPYSAIPLQHSKHSNASQARHAAQLYEWGTISSVLPPLVRGLSDRVGMEGRERGKYSPPTTDLRAFTVAAADGEQRAHWCLSFLDSTAENRALVASCFHVVQGRGQIDGSDQVSQWTERARILSLVFGMGKKRRDVLCYRGD